MLDQIAASARGGVNAVRGAEHMSDLAQALLKSSSQLGTLNVELLARDFAKIAGQDPERAASLLAEVKPQLSAAEQDKLVSELGAQIGPDAAHRLDASAGAQMATEAAAAKSDLELDLTQIGLSIAGIFDPTPVSDGLDGIISIARGDWLGAGIDAVSMIPYVGDAAKLGKLGHFAETIAKAVDLAKVDAKFAKQIAPVMDKIRDAIKALPLDHLPKPAREAIEKMAAKLDEFAKIGSVVAAKVGRNDVKWTVDGEGRTVKAEATLRELFPKAVRSSAEKDAQAAAGAAGKADDVGGHIIGHRFVKDQGPKNLFPQNVQFNNSAYRKMENEWAAWVGKGKEVQVDVRLVGNNPARPDRVQVSYEVFDPKNGALEYARSKSFKNEAGQTFDRVPSKDMK